MIEQECPKCQNGQVKKGLIHSANAVVHMFSQNNPRGKSSPLTSYYCSDCGYVLATYVENPEDLE